MDFAAAMDEIAERLETIDGLNRFEDEEELTPPGFYLSYPEKLDPHGTYHRGMARMNLQLMILVGPPGGRQTLELLRVWANDGPTGVLHVLESGTYTAFHDITVTEISFDAVEKSGIKYAAVFFDLDVAGSGVP